MAFFTKQSILMLLGLTVALGISRASDTPARKVLLEFFTTQSTYGSVEQTAIWEEIATEYGIVWVSHHAGSGTGDIFTIPESKMYDWFYESGKSTPAAMLDRTNLKNYGGGLVTPGKNKSTYAYYVKKLSEIPPSVTVDIERNYDADSRLLHITVSGDVVGELPPNPRLNIFLIEDGVVAHQEEGGSDYVHNRLMRHVLTEHWGDAVSFDSNRYSAHYSFRLPEGNVAENMEIVAFIANIDLYDRNNCQVCNAGSIKMIENRVPALNSVINDLRLKEHSTLPAHITLKENSRQTVDGALAYTRQMLSANNSGLSLKSVERTGENASLYRYVQTINGYPVEFTAWHIHEKNGEVASLNGEITEMLPLSLDFLLTEEAAREKALSHIGAAQYMWENDEQESLLKDFTDNPDTTYYPKGEKVIVPDRILFKDSQLKAAYKFNIFSQKPYDRKMVYVDAATGEILFELPLINHSDVIGTAHTQYSGVQEINTMFNGTEYILKDNSRGQGIRTFNSLGGYSHPLSIDFADDDNVWNNVNGNLDEYATDAHFGSMMVYDYYYYVHGRNSLDGNGYKLWSFVHFDLAKDYGTNINAVWNGAWVSYGDGSPATGVTPVVCMDVCGHEITHGLTGRTATLTYMYEPGALNEAFSDIFGTAVEFYATPDRADWIIGEDFGGTPWRSMSNPKQYNQPDTYQGEYWMFGIQDNGGVHINSGVLNHWFYLLCEGGSGTNDNGDYYTVRKIGMPKAERIAFKLLTEYLTANSEYADACYYGMQAAKDIYGEAGDELKAVTEAFYAVGLTDSPVVNIESIDRNDEPGTIVIAPNPNGGQFRVETSAPAQMRIIDLTGRQMYESELKGGVNNISVALPDGIYTVVISTKDSISSNKMIVKN